jgi:hypothetical protein
MSAMLASATENLGFPAGARLDWVCTTATQEITTKETATNGRVTGRVTVMGPHDRSEQAQEVRGVRKVRGRQRSGDLSNPWDRSDHLDLVSVPGDDRVRRFGVPEAGDQPAAHAGDVLA